MTPFRHLNFDPRWFGDLLFFGCAGWGDAAEVAVLEPVAVSLEGDDFGVVDEPVDHGCGDHVVAEDLAPAAEDFVAGDDQARPFVAGGHQLEEQVCGFGFEGDVADLVDHQQGDSGQLGQFGLESAGMVGLGEVGDPLGRGGEVNPVPGLAGPDRQADGQVGLAGAGWSQEDDVVAGGDEVQGAEMAMTSRLRPRA